MIGPLAIRLAHEAVTEWRKLDVPPPAPNPGELSCVCASTERAAQWDHDKRRPVSAARVGFGRPS